MLRVLATCLLLSGAAFAATSGPLLSRIHRPSVTSWKPQSCGVNNQITSFGKQLNPNSVLPEYPRPQLVREASTWTNLNGLWEWQASNGSTPMPEGPLSGSILVPFPVESCLSGIAITHKNMWYRLTATMSTAALDNHASGGRTLLHFGAVDWNTTVWVNGQQLGQHIGGYDGFTVDVTSAVLASGDLEILVFVFDPSDDGVQPNGKQRLSAIANPGGDQYTPASGIWQTVWLEAVPAAYVSSFKVVPTLSSISVNVTVASATQASELVKYAVRDGDKVVASGSGSSDETVSIDIPNPKLWEPDSPFLYNLSISLASGDAVMAYFGLRTSTFGVVTFPGMPAIPPQVGMDHPGDDLPNMPIILTSNDSSACQQECAGNSLCKAWAFGSQGCGSNSTQPRCWLKAARVDDAIPNTCRTYGAPASAPYKGGVPLLNNKFVFRAGWLDQSYWPDGIYTAATDEGLAFDILAVKRFGLNTVRLHQKVNPERWYHHADTNGIIVLQDAVQKYGGATNGTVPYFMQDLQAMLTGPVFNHPSVVQWETFNERDCFEVFNVTSVVEYAQHVDPSRLVDTDSGGPANDLHIGAVNDVHTYPYPKSPMPSESQYAMIGEFGGIGGGWEDAHSWVKGKCHTYLKVNTTQNITDLYVGMTKTMNKSPSLSCSIYTQITDVELECDGFINYDRSVKLSADQMAEIKAANEALIASHTTMVRTFMAADDAGVVLE